MFIESRYFKIYFQIVERARGRSLNCYAEKHHIVPRSLGGLDDDENIAVLTAREHFICHLLLTRMTFGSDRQKMTLAAWTMARTRKAKTKISARTYERLRIESADILRGKHTGRFRGPHSLEHKRKISEARKRFYEEPENREKARKKSTGIKHSEQTKALMSEQRKGKKYKPGRVHPKGMTGKSQTEETRAKMRAAWDRRRANPNDGTLNALRVHGRICHPAK